MGDRLTQISRCSRSLSLQDGHPGVEEDVKSALAHPEESESLTTVAIPHDHVGISYCKLNDVKDHKIVYFVFV